jgi:hypothetical protein
LEGVKELRVIQASPVLVGEQDLEAADSSLHNLRKLGPGDVVTARDAHVKAEVAGAVALRFVEPKVEGGERLLRRRGGDHFQESRRATHQRGAAGSFMRVLGGGAHDRQVDMDVRINEAGKDEFAGGVNHVCARRRRQVLADARDGFVLAPDVRPAAFGGRDQLAILDKQCHQLSISTIGHEQQLKMSLRSLSR